MQVEEPTRGKKWVAVAIDWPGLERSGQDEDQAIEKLRSYLPRYLPVAKRARLGKELSTQTKVKIVERYRGVGSTDFWGISFAPSSIDRLPMDTPVFERHVKLLRAAWAEFDAVAARVSSELRPGPRGGGRDRQRIVRHVLGNEGLATSPSGSRCRPSSTTCSLRSASPPIATASSTRCVTGTPKESRSVNWTIPYLLRHSAYHVLDHTWEMEDRDLS